MSALTVRIEDHATPARLAAAVAVLASLPESFRRTDAAGEVVVVDGGAGWAARAAEAARDGARALLVLDPGPADDADLAALLAADVPVILDVPGRHAEAVRRAAPRIHRLAAPGALLEARATVAASADLTAAARALALTGQALLGSAPADLTAVVDVEHHLMLTGVSASGVQLVISAVVGAHDHGRSTYRLLVGDRAAHVALPAPDSAEPGRASVTDAAGREDLPVVFESGRRTALRLARDAADGRCASHDVADLRSLLAVAPRLAVDRPG